MMDDLFLGCAFVSLIEEAAQAGGEPGSELNRRRANRYFEDALVEKHGRRIPETYCPKAKDVAMWTKGESPDDEH